MDPSVTSPPTAKPIPQTIAEAEFAGWLWLETVCPDGHGMTHYPWRLLAMRTKETVIANILSHMTCQACGAKPETFSLVRQARRLIGREEPELERLRL